MEKVSVHQVGGVEQLRLSVGDACSCRCTLFHNGKAKVLWVDNVRTVRSRRRRGYATHLMRAVMDLARERGVDAVELVVGRDNEAARRLYDKFDFAVVDNEHRRVILKRWKT